MGSGLSYYDNDYYYNPGIIYPNNRIVYINQPSPMIYPSNIIYPQNNIQMNTPHLVPNQNPNMRIRMPNFPNMIIMNQIQIPKKKEKKTIKNLTQLFDEIELTKDILDKGEQKNCSICLEDFAVGDKIIYLPCFHYYHSKCIDTWVKNSNICPLCNTEIKINQNNPIIDEKVK